MTKKIETAMAGVARAFGALARAYEQAGAALTDEQHGNVFAHIQAALVATKTRCDAARTVGKIGSAMSLDAAPPVMNVTVPHQGGIVQSPAKLPRIGEHTSQGWIPPVGRLVGSKEPIYDPAALMTEEAKAAVAAKSVNATGSNDGPSDVGFIED